MNSRVFALILTFGLACILGLFAASCLGGCANYDRDYSGTYNADSHRYEAGISIRRAEKPGNGSSSLSLKVTGDGKAVVR